MPVISQIYSYVKLAGADKILNQILEETSKPLFLIIKNWLLYGELQDPYKEFFVEIDEKITEDEVWKRRYVLNIQNVPNFFNSNITEKIFGIGKCVNFIRKYCDEPAFSLTKLKSKFSIELSIQERKMENNFQINNNNNNNSLPDFEKTINKSVSFKLLDENNLTMKNIENYKKCLDLLIELDDENKMNTNRLNELYSHVEVLYMEINKELVRIIFEKYKLRTHLISINRYMLLGQGDMMQYLMDLLFAELKKPATQIYKHNLLNILETAIRASNAQFHDLECINRLNIKLLDASTGDSGWDIFVLSYNLTSPLNAIITKIQIEEYENLFHFFWKLKRLEFSQDHQIWRNFMTYSHNLRQRFDIIRPYIFKANLFNQQIIHFVSTLHNYITLEVLETQYKILLKRLEQALSLDEIIYEHNRFLQAVTEQSLLNKENALICKKILQIFDLILRFKEAQV